MSGEVQLLDCIRDARRAAAYLCHITGQISNAHWEYFPRPSIFEVVFPLAGLVWSTHTTNSRTKVHFRLLVIAAAVSLR